MGNWTEKDALEYALRRARHRALGGLVAPEQQQAPPPTLVKKLPGRRGRQTGPVVLVTIIAVRQSLLDADNSTAGYKPLQDAIAAQLGIDDGDPRVRFEYDTVFTHGEPGTIVKVQELEPTQ